MSTYTQILYQIVYSTKNRDRTLSRNRRKALYDYIWAVLRNHRCHPYWINGVEDHLHIATHIHPQVALSDMVKTIKLSTSDFIKTNGVFRNFSGWQEGYAAFTYSHRDKDGLVEYIKNQEEHHRVVSYIEELRALLEEHGIEFNEKYLV